MVISKHPLMESTIPAWSSKPPFKDSSNGSTIPLPLQRGPDTMTFHDDHAGIFTLVSHAIFTTLPSISRFGLRSWVSMVQSNFRDCTQNIQTQYPRGLSVVI